MKRYNFTNEQEYQEGKARMGNGYEMILEKGGFFKAPELWSEEFQALAEGCLRYEIEHDMIKELL